MSKLKPCPFCGNKYFDITNKDDFYKLQIIKYGEAAIRMSCKRCRTDMWELTYEERNYEKRLELLIEKWNRRDANAVEVVCCEDCKNYNGENWCGEHQCGISPEDYCSRGKLYDWGD